MTGVRRATVADTEALLPLIRDHAAFELSQAIVDEHGLRELLAAPEAPATVLVAHERKSLLGYASITFDFSLWRVSRWAHLDCLFVRADARGHGAGIALLEAAAELAVRRGADRLEWQTPSWNEPATAFYLAAGATVTDKKRFHLDLPSRLPEAEAL